MHVVSADQHEPLKNRFLVILLRVWSVRACCKLCRFAMCVVWSWQLAGGKVVGGSKH